ncbi:class I SAM-dependent methyltransferase [Botrimarina sp.]|uniref:class I SAM-dependent methyltransferase n=1 Tax=Botrimarina sp. TaxID=2795802 RepID=UPI0032EB3B78
MDAAPRLLAVFFDVQRGLPRQGPGSERSTLEALALCSQLPADPDVLDVGCGPGGQTMTLARACGGRIVAVDTCDEYLDELRERAQRAGVAGRIDALNADMAALAFPVGSFDLVWCEAAAYVMGVAAALAAWRPLLRDRGYLAFSELVWLTNDPPPAAAEFWRAGYPAMTTVRGVLREVRESGYEPLGGFTLPDSDWWSDYYGPLQAKLPVLREKYAGDEQALGVVAATEAEIEVRRRYADAYGYRFFVARRAG